MIDYNFIPETLDWCTKHYTPPIKHYIICSNFGKCDGMDGSCWHCMEVTPYQHEMCSDETWLTGLLSPDACKHCDTREEAAEFIESHKQKFPRRDIIECLYEFHQREKNNRESYCVDVNDDLNQF
jgi:hypothetical protein